MYKLNPNMEQALVYGEKALQRATLQGNKEKEGSACGCLGIAYSCKGEHVKAIKWHEKYLQAAKKINNVTLEAQVFIFIFIFRRPIKYITSRWMHRRVGTSRARTLYSDIVK